MSCALLLVPFLGGIVALGDEGFDIGFLPLLLVASVWGERGELLALFPDFIAEALGLGLGPTLFLVSTADEAVGEYCAFEIVDGGLLALLSALASPLTLSGAFELASSAIGEGFPIAETLVGFNALND